MSSSSPRTNPSIDPPSKVMRPSSAASSSSTGIDTFLLTPKISANTRRTKRTFCSRASRTTSRFAEGRRQSDRVVEFINCNRQAKCELVLWAFKGARADLADLPQPVEDRVSVDVQRCRRGLHVLPDLEVELERAFELGRVLFVVKT